MAGFVLTQEERTAGDCLRVAVAQIYGDAYGVGYHDTPAADPRGPGWQEAWRAWALDHELRWWMSCELAPVHLAGWIGGVDSKAHPGCVHAIPFHHEQAILPEPTNYSDASIDDIREARWLLPAGDVPPPARWHRILRPGESVDRGIVYQVEIDGGGGSTWRRFPLATRAAGPAGR